MKYEYDYPMFSLAVDIAVVDSTSTVLLIRRGGDVNTGKLAFCGGFVDINETSKDAAIRELKEETNLELTSEDFIECSELVLDDVNRDPRGRVVSIVYIVYLNDRFSKYNLKAGDDATSLEFYSIHNDDVKNELAFDHHKIWDYVWNYL